MTDAKKTARARTTARAARPTKTTTPATAVAEVIDEPRQMEAFGLSLELPAELPFAVIRYAADDAGPKQMIGILTAILGKDQMERVWDAGLSVPQGIELVEQVMAEYGTSPGESSASSSS